MSKLTTKQELFVQGLISGLSQREAYKRAYDCENMKDTTIDVKASQMFAQDKIRIRHNELLDEHKKRALWTRERSINELIWLQEQSKQDIERIGVKQANSNAFLGAIKELNLLEDLYPKDKKEENTQENEIADMLRKMVTKDGT